MGGTTALLEASSPLPGPETTWAAGTRARAGDIASPDHGEVEPQLPTAVGTTPTRMDQQHSWTRILWRGRTLRRGPGVSHQSPVGEERAVVNDGASGFLGDPTKMSQVSGCLLAGDVFLGGR